MNTQHPITLPPELVQRWINEEDGLTAGHIAAQAARWGANQELEACCAEAEWLESPSFAKKLRAARRPKPPSLKEQALDELTSAERLYPADWSTIRHALEALPND